MPVKVKAIPVVVGGTLKESQAIKHITKYHHMLVSDNDNKGYKPGLWPPPHTTHKLHAKQSLQVLSYLRTEAVPVKPMEES